VTRRGSEHVRPAFPAKFGHAREVGAVDARLVGRGIDPSECGRLNVTD